METNIHISSAYYGIGLDVYDIIDKLIKNNKLAVQIVNELFGTVGVLKKNKLEIVYIDNLLKKQIIQIDEYDNIDIEINTLLGAFYGDLYTNLTDKLNNLIVDNDFNILVGNTLLEIPSESKLNKLRFIYQPY